MFRRSATALGSGLGGGTNTATVAGSIGGSLRYNGRDGNDTVTIADTAKIADNFFARLGAGDNVVNHNGNVGGNFTILSKNANDQFNQGTGAVIGGTLNNKLGLQQSGEDHEGHGGGCSHNTIPVRTDRPARQRQRLPRPAQRNRAVQASSQNATVARLAAAVSRLRR